MATLRLTRFNYSSSDVHLVAPEAEGTFGTIELPNGIVLFTCEKPWRQNKPNISCVPEGTYTLRKRRSGIVERTSKGKYITGWEVTNVPDRTFIMFHIANWPHELEGCIAVGKSYGILFNALGVNSSADAFDIFMESLEGEDEHTLIIDHYEP